jgi:hypothetical protein
MNLITQRSVVQIHLWFPKMSQHARRLRISNIHADVYEWEFTKNKACNIVT